MFRGKKANGGRSWNLIKGGEALCGGQRVSKVVSLALTGGESEVGNSSDEWA